MNVLEHVVNPSGVMKEIKRVVKPKGVVIIGVDSKNFLFSTVWSIWNLFNGRVWRHAHLHKFTPEELERLFKRRGFVIKEKQFFNFGMAEIFLLTK